jgi:hypothetical protein
MDGLICEAISCCGNCPEDFTSRSYRLPKMVAGQPMKVLILPGHDIQVRGISMAAQGRVLLL